MKRSRTLTVALAIALTLGVAACGSSTKTTTKTSGGSRSSQSSSANRSSSGSTDAGNSDSSASGSYPTAFTDAFIKACDTNGATKAYCECVIAYLRSNVAYDTVLSSQKAISQGKRPSWYAQAIGGCRSEL